MSESPSDLSAVERARAAVMAIQQVVQAVWTLARAEQPRVEAMAGETSAYLAWVEDLIARFQAGAPSDRPGDVLWVVAGPERPFCGGLARRIFEQIPEAGPVLLLGRRQLEALSAESALRERIVRALPAASGPEDVDTRARDVARTLLELAHPGPVRVLHPVAGRSELVSAPLLSLSGVAAFPESLPETYSSPERLLSVAVQEAVSGRLTVALVEALRTEVHARLVAADAARKGCERKIEALERDWRVLRQETITAELLELFAGRLESEEIPGVL